MYVCLLNTDATLLRQKRLLKAGDTLVDLSRVHNLRLMSPGKVLEEVSLKLSRIPVGLSFLGSGDFHHLTLLFLRKLRTSFTLVVLDRHLDMHTAPPGFVTCGSWLREALGLPCLEEVYVLGVQEEALTNTEGWLGATGDATKLKVYPSKAFLPAVREVLEKVRGRRVYISVDKDVLASPCAWTTWGQGELRSGPVFYLLRNLKNCARVIGVDVCGEYIPASVIPGPRDWGKIEANEVFNLAMLRLFAGSKCSGSTVKAV
ncbi:MAG: arginase family protein [Thermanaeromonas sp.]|uniref:arginase family protein n=1 Tax=Thermanaeromonas sp. TaxID=2003697 RepID=UPI0024379688|nr:arginase family protein [Thermanaeromonas sp.]MCG0278544.1 arginase family protein [Thermanaeromonas sp.]